MSQSSAESVLKKWWGFLKISMYLHTQLAAETHLADGEFLQISVNREFLKLRGRTRIPVVSKTEFNILNLNK